MKERIKQGPGFNPETHEAFQSFESFREAELEQARASNVLAQKDILTHSVEAEGS
jgi:hypothetical protein